MPREVEGDRDQPVARGRRRERLHQLLRAGEAVRDDDHRPRAGAAGRAEHRYRDRIRMTAQHLDALAGRLQGPQRLAGQQQPAQREQHAADQGHATAHVRPP